MLTISGTSLCTQDALNPSTAQPSTAHYCLEELKLFFWWFKWWIASGAGLMYPHRQKFLSPPSPLALVPVFFYTYPMLLQSLPSPSGLWGWYEQHRQPQQKTEQTDRTTSKLTPQPMVFTVMPWSCTFCIPSGASQSCLLLISCSLNHCFSCPLNDHCLLYFSLLSHSFSLLALSFSWYVSTCGNTVFSIRIPLIHLSLTVCYCYC